MDATNRIYWTNRFDSRHFDHSRFRDEAITPNDQSLLIRIRQTIITEISVSTGGGGNWMPIHCSVDSGNVRLTGLVRSMDEGQRLLATVSGMPGVTGVENGLSTLPQDQALNENDRVILTQIRQLVPLSQPPAPWTPVSFDVRQGAVGIVGIVPTTQESQRIETVVRQVPRVVRVSNTLVVDASVNNGATSTSTVPR
jgi:osmotically-inducible protein OsmY